MARNSNKIEKLLADRSLAGERSYYYFHPSQLGDCPRQLALMKFGVPTNDDLHYRTQRKFQVGHSLHEDVQGYFRDAGILMTDEVVDIRPGVSAVHKDKNGEWAKRVIVTGKSGREYPYIPGSAVWIEGFDKLNPKTRIEDVKAGNCIYLAEIPIEVPSLHMAGHVDGLILDNGEPCVLEIKSINKDGFLRLFFNSKAVGHYKHDEIDHRICHICGWKKTMTSNMAQHMVEEHYNYAEPQEKHLIQANSYMQALDVNKTLFWYENKDNQEVYDVIVSRDDDLIKKLRKYCSDLWDIVEVYETLSGDDKPPLPAMPDWAIAEGKGNFKCTFCTYNYFCWNQSGEPNTWQAAIRESKFYGKGKRDNT
jgi:CRISPR/Cas system-associated exonuclease Cas4 (RecB family)